MLTCQTLSVDLVEGLSFERIIGWRPVKVFVAPVYATLALTLPRVGEAIPCDLWRGRDVAAPLHMVVYPHVL